MDKTVIVKTPFRISLAGGGTDVSSYCKKYGGTVIGFSINKYIIVTLRTNSFYQKNEVVINNTIETFGNDREIYNKYLRELVHITPLKDFYKMSVLSDVPEQTGLGGSATFLNSIIYARKLVNQESIAKNKLAELSSQIEIENLNRSVGKQDHYLTTLGGMNLLEFDTNMNTSYKQIFVGKNCREYFKSRLLLFYSNISRSAGTVLLEQDNKIKNANESTIKLMHEIKDLVNPMYQAILDDNPNKIGPIIAEHWNKKQQLSSKVVNSRISQLIDICYKNGADGCKILGAGGGGFILVSVKEGYQEQLRKVMKMENIQELEFDIEFNGTVSKTI